MLNKFTQDQCNQCQIIVYIIAITIGTNILNAISIIINQFCLKKKSQIKYLIVFFQFMCLGWLVFCGIYLFVLIRIPNVASDYYNHYYENANGIGDIQIVNFFVMLQFSLTSGIFVGLFVQCAQLMCNQHCVVNDNDYEIFFYFCYRCGLIIICCAEFEPVHNPWSRSATEFDKFMDGTVYLSA